MDEKAMKELFDIFKKKEEPKTEDANVDASWLFVLLLVMLFFGYAPTDKAKENYLQGKVDAYEKIIRRMF